MPNRDCSLHLKDPMKKPAQNRNPSIKDHAPVFEKLIHECMELRILAIREKLSYRNKDIYLGKIAGIRVNVLLEFEEGIIDES